MDRDTLRQYILENYAAVNDFPWISNPTYEVFRHESSKKWFGLVMELPRHRLALQGEDIVTVLNLKCDRAFRLTARRAGLFPGLSHEQGALDKR